MNSLLKYFFLNQIKFCSRLLLVNNLSYQSSFCHSKYKNVFDLINKNIAMNQNFWRGIYCCLDKEQLRYIAKKTMIFFWIRS